MARRNKPVRAAGAAVPTNGLERYRALLGEAEYTRLLAALAEPLPQGIRVNRLKIDPAEAMRAWPEWYGWQAEPVSYCPAGWQIAASAQRPSQTPEYKLGFYYIQDAASMLPAELMDFDGLDQPLVLDLAAAPGGKTTHLVDRIQDNGLVLANDSSPSRIAALKAVLQDWGAMGVAVTNFAGEGFGAWFPEVFDRVLLDAPCSMENLRPAEGHAQRPISDRERTSLAERQTRLLVSAFRALKPGGQLVYSTCTLAPEEDEVVVDALLRQFPGQAAVAPVGDRLPMPAPALGAYGETRFDPQVENAVRLWPHRYGTSGFFAARIVKLGSAGSQAVGDAPRRPFEKTGFSAVSRADGAAFLHRFHADYGFDLGAQLESRRMSLWRRGTGLIALPETLLRAFPDLPVQAAGLLLGEDTPDGFVLSHELTARFGLKFTENVLRVSLEDAGSWLAGQDLPIAAGAHPAAGKIVVLVDERGRLLGRGKRLAARIRNLLPRWLLR